MCMAFPNKNKTLMHPWAIRFLVSTIGGERKLWEITIGLSSLSNCVNKYLLFGKFNDHFLVETWKWIYSTASWYPNPTAQQKNFTLQIYSLYSSSLRLSLTQILTPISRSTANVQATHAIQNSTQTFHPYIVLNTTNYCIT